MIGKHPRGERSDKRLGRRLLASALLAACIATLITGCSLMPKSMRNLPGKIGIKSQEAELRAKVEADKFPTAEEAGI
jgi:hypothetical protein